MFSTTTYERTDEGLAETHVPDAIEPGPGLFCVEASDNGGRTYSTNRLRWTDIEDAKRWGVGLSLRWFGASNIRVRGCDDEGEPTGETLDQIL